MELVDLAEKIIQFPDHWNPEVVAEVNDMHVKLVKMQGEFVWHSHADEDELFLVVAGELWIRMRDRDVDLAADEFFIVPRGVEHQPVADAECQVLLLEPKQTINTGDVREARTVIEPQRI